MALAKPEAGEAAHAGVVMIGAVAVTDANGHPLPCEAMLKEISAAPAPSGEKATKVADLVAKATERCNADDDARADAFSAAAMQELAQT